MISCLNHKLTTTIYLNVLILGDSVDNKINLFDFNKNVF